MHRPLSCKLDINNVRKFTQKKKKKNQNCEKIIDIGRMEETFVLWFHQIISFCRAYISFLVHCSDWRAQVDHEDSAVMDLITSDDWVQSEHHMDSILIG